MSFIRKNKFVIVAIGVFLILVILAFRLFSMFSPSDGGALYGDRLEGIEEVELNDKKLNNIENTLKEDSIVKNATASVEGKIVEVIVTVQDETAVDTAKSLSTKVLDAITTKEKKFYDVQIFIKKTTEANDFPIIGYKHHANDDFSWTKDRGAE